VVDHFAFDQRGESALHASAGRTMVVDDLADRVHACDLLLDWLAEGHRVTWTHDTAALPSSEICFYLSYGRIVDTNLLARHKNNLMAHASDLPKGRGWSPLTWEIL